MTNTLTILAAGVLTALAFAAFPAEASAEGMEADCSAAPFEAVVQSTGNAVLTADSGTAITCTTITGTVKQTAATSSTATIVLTFERCSPSCHNEGAGTNKIWTNTMLRS